MAFEFTDSNFEETALDGLVLIGFWAIWAGGSDAIAPKIEELAADYKGRALVGKLDADNNPDVVRRFGIRGVPVQIILLNGVLMSINQGPAAILPLSIKDNLASQLDSILAIM